MRTKILVPLIAVIMVLTAAGMGHARSPYVPNYFSYDPDWKGELPSIGGYVDVYLTYAQQTDGQYNGLEAEQVSFTVDRAELFLQHRVTDWADGYFEVSITAFDDTDISLDEAWLRVVVPWGEGLTLMGGVYDVPIGIGANENIDIWNWQFKMVNLLVAPWAFTGGLIEYEVGDLVNINFWIANDWGFSEAYGVGNTGRANTDTELVYGGRLGVSPDEMFDVGISVVFGNQRRQPLSQVNFLVPGLPPGTQVPLDDLVSTQEVVPGGWQSRTMVDLDFRWLDLPDFLGALDFELWWLEVTDQFLGMNASGNLVFENSQAYGGVAQFNFATPMESLSVSLGYEVVWDENGIVFGGDPNGRIDLKCQTRQSVEITPIWALGDHVIVALTWRSDWSNKDVMTDADGDPTDFAWLTAWEWYYYF
jgi:hypothetical protein